MVRTRQDALRLVREFRDHLAVLYGGRLKGVYLYGSYARDEANEDSDIDVAVVLDGAVRDWEEGKRTIHIVSELSLRENHILTPFFLSDDEYRRAPEAIHRSMKREGVPV